MQAAEKVRLGWSELYERVRDAGMVCRERPHAALGGATPIDRCRALIDQTPLHGEVDANFNQADERLRVQHYPIDLARGRLSARLAAHQPPRGSSVKGDSNRRAQRADPLTDPCAKASSKLKRCL